MGRRCTNREPSARYPAKYRCARRRCQSRSRPNPRTQRCCPAQRTGPAAVYRESAAWPRRTMRSTIQSGRHETTERFGLSLGHLTGSPASPRRSPVRARTAACCPRDARRPHRRNRTFRSLASASTEASSRFCCIHFGDRLIAPEVHS